MKLIINAIIETTTLHFEITEYDQLSSERLHFCQQISSCAHHRGDAAARLILLQLGHLDYINTGADPLVSFNYQFWLFMTPFMFYLFSRSILFEENRIPRPRLMRPAHSPKKPMQVTPSRTIVQ